MEATTSTRIGRTLVAEGKTKKIWNDEKFGNGYVVIESKPSITAHNDPSATRTFEQKARNSTTTTCRVFELLTGVDVAVAYVQQISETEFLAPLCQMIPLEVVARRYAVGSYLKRHPEIPSTTPPYRFDTIVAEFYAKTTNGSLTYLNGSTLTLPLRDRDEEDPLIADYTAPRWKLLHPKVPLSDPRSVLPFDPIEPVCGVDMVGPMLAMLFRTFHTLEKAWSNLGYNLIDLKIEFGLTAEGALLLADVIDNDSWRLQTKDWEPLDKQLFRDKGLTSTVIDNYERVADLAGQLSFP